jgi:hypothetical protein
MAVLTAKFIVEANSESRGCTYRRSAGHFAARRPAPGSAICGYGSGQANRQRSLKFNSARPQYDRRQRRRPWLISHWFQLYACRSGSDPFSSADPYSPSTPLPSKQLVMVV